MALWTGLMGSVNIGYNPSAVLLSSIESENAEARSKNQRQSETNKFPREVSDKANPDRTITLDNRDSHGRHLAVGELRPPFPLAIYQVGSHCYRHAVSQIPVRHLDRYYRKHDPFFPFGYFLSRKT
jgi:hypothetical protein